MSIEGIYFDDCYFFFNITRIQQRIIERPCQPSIADPQRIGRRIRSTTFLIPTVFSQRSCPGQGPRTLPIVGSQCRILRLGTGPCQQSNPDPEPRLAGINIGDISPFTFSIHLSPLPRFLYLFVSRNLGSLSSRDAFVSGRVTTNCTNTLHWKYLFDLRHRLYSLCSHFFPAIL